jgi:hypothetical protein
MNKGTWTTLVAGMILAISAQASDTIWLPNLGQQQTGTNVGGKFGSDVNVISSITANSASVGLFGAATPASGTAAGGSDGTNLRALHTDASGNLQTGRTWSLLNTTDSVNSVQSGAWSTGRTWTLLNTTDSVNAVESGVWNITNISGTVTLPTGAATSANQTTANTSLSSIDTKTPALGQALAASSVPVVLTAAQITTLTPPTTITANIGTTNGLALDSTVAKDASLTTLNTSVNTLLKPASTLTAVTTLGTITNPVPTKAAVNATASGGSGTVSTVITLTAPANSAGFVLQNLSTSTANVRYLLGGAASTSVGIQLAPGQDSGFIPAGSNISLIAESGTQNYSYAWVSQ